MTSRIEVNKRLLVINSISGIIAHIINVSILVWLQQYLLRRISTSEYSLYPVISSVMIFVFMLRSILAGGIARYVTEAYARGDDTRVTQITSTMFLIQLAGGLIILCFGLLFSWHIDKILTINSHLIWDARIMMGLMIISFAIQLSGAPFAVGLFVKQKFVLLNIIHFCTSLLRILILFILLFGLSTRVLWVVVASESANLCGLIIRILISRRFLPDLRFLPRKVNWEITRELFSFQSWTFISQVAYKIHTSVDPIILNKLATNFDVTCFYLGSLFKRQIDNTLLISTQPILPGLTAMYAKNEKSRLENAYLRYGRYYLWIFMIIALPLIIYRKELIGLYVGYQYMIAAKVLALLLAENIIVLGNAMLYNLAVATGQMKELSIRIIIMQLINISLTLYLVGILKLGAIGSAIATFSVHIIGAPLFEIPLGLRLANVNFKKWLKTTVLPGYLPGMGASVIWIVLWLINRPDSWFMLIFNSVLGCVCYLIILFTICLQENDRKDLKKLLFSFKQHGDII